MNVDYMGMEPQGKATDEEMEKFEKAKNMATQQAKDTAPEQRKAVGLEGNNSAAGGDPITGLLKATGAFVVGAANAIGSNSLLGAGRQDPSTFGEYAGYAETGQTFGDLISIVQGTAEVLLSAVGTGTEVVTAPFTGGASAVAIAPTIGLGIHGATTASTAVSNLLSPSRVEVNSEIPKSQLGPSGKPKIHTVSKPTLKSAKDAARNNPKSNSSPVKHTSDKGQKTHYHSTKNGKKLEGKDNVHYENRSSKKNLNE